jgi:putative phage-type endonuclease
MLMPVGGRPETLKGEKLAAFLDARCGKLTASCMAAAMDYLKGGGSSAKRTKLLKDLLTERLTGSSVRHFVSEAMQWGTETEPENKEAFMAKTGLVIEPCGTFDHPTIDLLAATPDGLIDADGVFESKCPTTQTHIDWILAGEVPKEYRPQMCLQILCTGRDYAWFSSYDPRIKDESRRLFIRRYIPTEAELAEVESEAIKFLDELEAMFMKISTMDMAA